VHRRLSVCGPTEWVDRLTGVIEIDHLRGSGAFRVERAHSWHKQFGRSQPNGPDHLRGFGACPIERAFFKASVSTTVRWGATSLPDVGLKDLPAMEVVDTTPEAK
jgi:hypothetical protein